MGSARPNRDAARARQARLRILAITDLHARLLDYDYDRDLPAPGTGLVCLADRIAAARAEEPNALLFDNGDTYQGTALADLLAHEQGRGIGAAVTGNNPITEALGALGVDAAVPGNHDFNFGIEPLLARVQQARFPFVLTNLVERRGAQPHQDRPLLPTTLMLERSIADDDGVRHNVRIGVIGLVPPQTLLWDHDHLSGRTEVRDVLDAAAHWVPDLKRAGADIVVALCHGGLGQLTPASGLEDAARLVARLPQVDVVLAGHRHEIAVEAATDGAAPIVSAGFNGSHLGQIDLVLRRSGYDAPWHVTASHAALVPATTKPGPDAAEIKRIAAPSHARTRAVMTEAIGRTDTPLHSFFAGALPSAATALVARAQAEAVRMAIADSPHAALPLLSAAAAFKTGGPDGANNYTHIKAGPVLRHNVFDLYPFPNTVAAIRTDGAGIKSWLEQAARLFAGLHRAKAVSPLFAPGAVGYDFDLVHGVRFTIDLACPAGDRIRDLRWPDDRPLAPDAPLILATNNYRASGSGGYPVCDVIFRSRTLTRDVVASHVARHSPIAPCAGADWRFAGPPGTRVSFATSACARPYLADTRLEAAETTPDGLMRLLLTL
ncbi:bifunctional metallophosphatase/5'-nucleotidase [Roseivivax sp. CAU 1753]